MADKTVVVKFIAQTSGYVSQVNGLNAATRSIGNEAATAAAKAKSATQQLAAASIVASKIVLLGLGGALALSAKAAIDFESSFAGVRKTVQASEPEFAALASRIRELATRIPVNVNELNRIAEIGGQLGIGIEDLEGFVEVVAALGVTTNLSTEQAATGLARLANIMGTSRGDFDRLGSIIVDLGNNFATTESEILSMGLRLAPIGATLGASEEAVLGLAAALTAVGIPAERGSTSIQRLFIEMAAAVEEGDAKLATFARTAGMTADEFASLFGEDPTRAYLEFVKGIDRVKEAGGDVFRIFSDLDISQQRSIATILASANANQDLESALDRAKEAGEENTAMWEEAAKRYGTTASQIQIMANNFTDLRITLGQSAVGAIAAALEWINALIDGIKNNIETVKQLGSAFLWLAGARVGLAFVMWVGKSISQVWALVSSMGAAVTATKLAAAALGAFNIVAAGLTLITIGLIGKWTEAAQKARALETAVRAINDAWEEQGQLEALNQFRTQISDMKTFTTEIQDFLLGQGVTRLDLAKATLFGDPESLEKINAALEVMKGRLADIPSIAPTVGEWGNVQYVPDQDMLVAQISEAEGNLSDLEDFYVELGLLGEGVLEERRRRQLERVLDLNFTYPDLALRNMAKSLGALRTSYRQTVDDIEDRPFTFADMMAEATEEGLDAMQDFREDAADIWDGFRTDIRDTFYDLEADLLDSLPVFDEYEGALETSLGDIRKSLELFTGDLQAWVDTRAEILARSDIGAAEIAIFDEFDLAEKAFISSLSESELDEFIADIFLPAFESTKQSAKELFMQDLPRIMGDGITSVKEQLIARAQELGEAGLEPKLAFEQAVKEGFEALGIDIDPSVVSEVADELALDPSWFTSGGAAALEFGRGFFAFWASIFGPEFFANLGFAPRNFSIDDLRSTLGNLPGDTPSSAPPRTITGAYVPAPGYNVTAGLTGGGSGDTSTSGGPTPRSLELTIVNPQTNNLSEDVQSGLLLDNLIEELSPR
jgi:TP901 family phage tail tape measure protein